MSQHERDTLTLASAVTPSSSVEELERAIIELSVAVVECRYDVGEALLYNQWRRCTKLLIKNRRDRHTK